SATHVDGERLAIFTHGTAQYITADSPDYAPLDAYFTGYYGSSPSTWGPNVVFFRLPPTWRLGYAMDPADFPHPSGHAGTPKDTASRRAVPPDARSHPHRAARRTAWELPADTGNLSSPCRASAPDATGTIGGSRDWRKHPAGNAARRTMRWKRPPGSD